MPGLNVSPSSKFAWSYASQSIRLASPVIFLAKNPAKCTAGTASQLLHMVKYTPTFESHSRGLDLCEREREVMAPRAVAE